MTPTEPRRTAISPRVAASVALAARIMLRIPRSSRDRMSRPIRDPRPCIVCGVDHTGNNAFCSAECCRVYQARKGSGQ